MYNLDPLYALGGTGSGETEAIVTLAALDVGGPENFWNDFANVPAHSAR